MELAISQPHSFFLALPVSQYSELCKLLRQITCLFGGFFFFFSPHQMYL